MKRSAPTAQPSVRRLGNFIVAVLMTLSALVALPFIRAWLIFKWVSDDLEGQKQNVAAGRTAELARLYDRRHDGCSAGLQDSRGGKGVLAARSAFWAPQVAGGLRSHAVGRGRSKVGVRPSPPSVRRRDGLLRKSRSHRNVRRP